LLVVLQHITDN